MTQTERSLDSSLCSSLAAAERGHGENKASSAGRRIVAASVFLAGCRFGGELPFCVFRSEAFMHHTATLPLARRSPTSGIGFGNSDESAASQSGLMRRCFSAATSSFAVSSVNVGFC